MKRSNWWLGYLRGTIAAAQQRKQKMKRLSTGQKLSTKKAERKRETSPRTPYKRKAKGKETKPGFFENPLSPRACVRGASRYQLAGAAADELVDILQPEDRIGSKRLWAFYCYHHEVGIIFDKAYECASRKKQGEIENAATAFQRWLSDNFTEI